MMTPEEGEALTRLAAAGYQVGEISLSIWGLWTVRASRPDFGTVSQSGSTRLQAIARLRDDVERWDAWRPLPIEPPRRA